MKEHNKHINIFSDLPSHIQQIALAARLGELRKVYSAPNTTSKVMGITFGVIGYVILSIFALLNFLAEIFNNSLDISNVSTSLLIVAGIVIMLGMLSLCLSLSFLMALSEKKFRRIYLCEQGMIYDMRYIPQVFRWDQIESIQREVTHVIREAGQRITIYAYRVRHQDGSEIYLRNPFSKAETSELIEILLEKTAQHFAPLAVRVAPTKSVSALTSFIIDKQGIHTKQEQRAWAEIEEIVSNDGAIIVRQAKQ